MLPDISVVPRSQRIIFEGKMDLSRSSLISLLSFGLLEFAGYSKAFLPPNLHFEFVLRPSEELWIRSDEESAMSLRLSRGLGMKSHSLYSDTEDSCDRV